MTVRESNKTRILSMWPAAGEKKYKLQCHAKRLVFTLKTALSPFDTPKNLKNFRPAAGLYPKSTKILLRNKGGFLARNSTDVDTKSAFFLY